MSFIRSFGFYGFLAIGASFLATPVLADELPLLSASTTTDSVAPTLNETPSAFFHMADGRFFHPGTGLTANTEQELRQLILQSQNGISIPASSLIPDPLLAQPIIPAPAPVQLPVLAAIERARAELQQRIIQEQDAHPAKSFQGDDVWRSVTLAVWDQMSDQLRYVQLETKGSQVRKVDPGVSVRINRVNGVNSEFIVDANGPKTVLALQYPILQAVPGKKNTYTFQDVVYTPYSALLHTPEVVEAGRAYLDQVVDQVYAKLRQDGIKSRIFPDQLVVDVVDPGVVKSIAAIEHLDQSSLTQDPRKGLDSFFVILAGNKQDAYAYSRSSAGALGLVQFIPSTYLRLAQQKVLGLQPDFETGMRNPLNAIRAQALYLDILMDEFPNSFRDRLAANPAQATEFVVAAYNGGSSRVRKAMDDWSGMFDGSEAKTLSRLQTSYANMKEEIESLRQKTLKQTDKAKRAKLQTQLDNKRAEAKKVLAQINSEQAALLRKETISYVLKFRALQQDQLIPGKMNVQVTATAQQE